MADTGPVIELDGVTVAYGRRVVLSDLTATLREGAVGLLGPNGAGKSTLIKTLLGFLRPTAGRVRVLGLDVTEAPLAVRARVGYMPERDAHMAGMTAVAFVAYCGELSGLAPSAAMQRAHEVLFYVGLGEARYRTVDTYSTGMKQRIKLAQALVHDPDLLLLDEPTNGLDPAGREDMLAVIRDLSAAKGMHVIVSSHLLPDVERTCDQVLVMAGGRVVAEGHVPTLAAQMGQVVELRLRADADARAAFVARLEARGLGVTAAPDGGLHLQLPDTQTSTEIFRLAVETGVQVRHLRPRVASLEDMFLRAVEGA